MNIVMGFCAGAGDKEGRTPKQINLEDNAYTKRCLDALYNPRHVPTVITPVTLGPYMSKGYRIESLSPFRCEYGGFDE